MMFCQEVKKPTVRKSIHSKDQDLEGRERKGIYREFRCVMCMYQLPTRNVIVMYYKQVLIKIKMFKT